MSGKVSSSFQGEANFFHRKDWILEHSLTHFVLSPGCPNPSEPVPGQHVVTWSPSHPSRVLQNHYMGTLTTAIDVKGVVWSLYNKSPKFLQDIQLGQGHIEWMDNIDTLHWVRLNTNPNIPGFETQNKYYVYFPTPPTALPKGSKKAIG